MFSVNKKTT